METKVKRNIAKVHYQKMADGSVLIRRLEGFLSREEIEKRYGAETLRAYKNLLHMYNANPSANAPKTILLGHSYGAISHIKAETAYTKETFSWIIAAMKECGANLVKAIREVKKTSENPVQVIEI